MPSASPSLANAEGSPESQGRGMMLLLNGFPSCCYSIRGLHLHKTVGFQQWVWLFTYHWPSVTSEGLCAPLNCGKQPVLHPHCPSPQGSFSWLWPSGYICPIMFSGLHLPDLHSECPQNPGELSHNSDCAVQ